MFAAADCVAWREGSPAHTGLCSHATIPAPIAFEPTCSGAPAQSRGVPRGVRKHYGPEASLAMLTAVMSHTGVITWLILYV